MSKKRKVITVVIIFLALLILYMVTGDYYYGALLIALILFIGCSAIICKISGRKIKCSISGGNEADAQSPVDFTITVRNKSLIPLFNGKMECKILNLLNGEKDVLTTNWSIGPKGVSEIVVNINPVHCGCIRIEMEQLQIRDFLGIFTRNVSLNMNDDHYALPKKGSININRDDISKYDMESYKYSPYKSGSDSSEVFDVREYKAGDKIKAIHWKLTAKTGNVMTKVASYPTDTNLMILLDKCNSADKDTIDAMMDLYFTLSWEIFNRGISYRLGFYDYNRKNFVIEEAKTVDDLYRIVEKTLASPFADETTKGESTIYHLIESDIEMNSNIYIYITTDERDVERLRNYGEVSIYRPEDFK